MYGENWILELDSAARAELEELAHSTERAEADRARAILWSVDGWSSPQIAQRLSVRPERVRLWRCWYRSEGVAALRARPIPGPSGERGERALAAAEAILAEPRLSSAPPWTLPRLAAEIQRRTGVRISQPRLSVLLRKKGGSRSAARATRSRVGRTKRPSPRPTSG
jgi:transposase